MKKLFSAFIDPNEERKRPGLRRFWLILLLVIILAGWGYFLEWGRMDLYFLDWAEINAPRLAFLKDAVTKGQLPLHMPDSSALHGVTDRYMALPDLNLSPQVLLLRWMSVGTFILFNTWLSIVLGYLGLLRLKKRLSLSLLNFTWISLLFFFNGHMLSHYAVGHVTWSGTFLLSWFADLVFALLDGERGPVWEAKMAFLLFAVFLQGSFHQYFWCAFFLAILAVTYWKTFFPILKAGIGSALLSAVRIIPPAMVMGEFDNDFLGGYTRPIQLFNAFVKILHPSEALDQAKTGAVMGWWEFDFYIGLTAVLVLIAAGLAWLLLRERGLGFPALICPIAVLTFFSYKYYYAILRRLRIPLFSGERVSSRFLILPFLFVLIAGLTALQRFLMKKRIGPCNVLLSAALIPSSVFIWKHLSAWRVPETAQAFWRIDVDLAAKTVANHPDQPYTTGLLIGMVITLLSAAVLIFRAKKAGSKTADPAV